MKILGINCLNHDAAVSVIENGEILFAAHSERYSRKKNDEMLNDDIINEALSHGEPDKIVFYERPFIKKTRQLYSGQYSEVFQSKNIPKNYLKRWFQGKKINYVDHHLSHASAGYFTSPYEECLILVIDGIGEWDTISLWSANKNKIKKIKSIKYPHSLGLFYSAVTQAAGLKPCEEEYILMGMSAWGSDSRWQSLKKDLFNNSNYINLKYNLHKGLGKYGKEWDKFDLAASTQRITETILEKIVSSIKKEFPNMNNLVYMGGCALNCVANGKILPKYYDNVWIMPNPGDAGSSLGCAAYAYRNQLNWNGPFLGTNIEGSYPINGALRLLERGRIFGIANGRAEFGPRALGNRSLLADPRGSHIKDRVNEIKKRQKFRPFAPAIMEEHANEYFEMNVKKTPYMQYTVRCRHPEKFPAICHVDNTSRVQTVSKKDNLGFYNLLSEFYKKTGCPMLLNTSLNIKGQPIVNNVEHAIEFSNHYGVEVLTRG